jgi:hypothetical protein
MVLATGLGGDAAIARHVPSIIGIASSLRFSQ